MSGRNRRFWILAGVAVIVLLIGSWWVSLKPDEDERRVAVATACNDAAGLARAGLLDEALAAYRSLADEDLPCAAQVRAVVRYGRRAAHDREQGDVYLHAAQLSRKAEKRAEARQAARAAERFEAARQVAIQRAIAGYTRSLQEEPHHAGARESLRNALALMAVPPDPGANARCRAARELRRAHLLGEAGMLYGQALRTGRTTRCVANELRKAREDRAEATRMWREGEIAADDGEEQDGRKLVVAALALDPTMAGAKQALAAREPPDPDAATVEDQVEDAVDWLEGAAGSGQDAATTLTDHGGAAALLLLLAGLVVLGLLVLRHWVARYPRGRAVLHRLHVRSVNPRQYLVSPFTPVDRGDTSTTVFAHWLMVQDPKPEDRGDELVKNSGTPLDVWEPETPKDDVDTMFQGQAGLVTAAWEWVKRANPRDETYFVGKALERCEHGPGLRVLVKERGGHVIDAQFWWATDLPGPALTADDDEAEARHALAIYAAAWARQTAQIP